MAHPGVPSGVAHAHAQSGAPPWRAGSLAATHEARPKPPSTCGVSRVSPQAFYYSLLTAHYSLLTAHYYYSLATGITFSGADVGGFLGKGGGYPDPDAELFTRWFEAGLEP